MIKISRCTKVAVAIITEMGFSIETVTLIKDQVCRRPTFGFDIQDQITFPMVLGVHRGGNRFVLLQNR